MPQRKENKWRPGYSTEGRVPSSSLPHPLALAEEPSACRASAPSTYQEGEGRRDSILNLLLPGSTWRSQLLLEVDNAAAQLSLRLFTKWPPSLLCRRGEGLAPAPLPRIVLLAATFLAPASN